MTAVRRQQKMDSNFIKRFCKIKWDHW